MATVQTVKGPVDTNDLGRVLMHEHVFVLSPEIEQNYPSWDEEAEVKNAIARLNELKANGIDTIVDLTVTGLGRYIPRIERITTSITTTPGRRTSAAPPFAPVTGEAVDARPKEHVR